jgi:hypothetical protein
MKELWHTKKCIDCEKDICSQSTKCRSCAKYKGGLPKCGECGVRLGNYGRKYCHRHKFAGERSLWWKGGVNPFNKTLRSRVKMKEWREEVYMRDDYTCQHCGEKGVELNADHVMPLSLFPELAYDVLNGQTLCVPCHKNTDSFSGKLKNKITRLNYLGYVS